jgi:hypothetical protein
MRRRAVLAGEHDIGRVNVAHDDRHGRHTLARPADGRLLILVGFAIALLECLAPVDVQGVDEMSGQAADCDVEIAASLSRMSFCKGSSARMAADSPAACRPPIYSRKARSMRRFSASSKGTARSQRREMIIIGLPASVPR